MVLPEGADGNRLRWLFWACVVGLFALLAATVQRGFRGISDYSLEEWLISYPGHFMRRGLRGSIVLELAHLTHKDGLKIASFFVAILYGVAALVAVWLVFRWLSKNARTFILPVLLSPAGIFFYFNAHNGAFRFDLVFVLITAAHVEICLRTRNSSDYLKWAGVLFATLGVVAMLTSEVFLFVGIPINVFLCVRRFGQIDLRTVAVFALPLVAAGACFLKPGTVDDAARIYGSSGLTPNIHSPVRFIGMSAGDEVKLVADWTKTQGSSVLFLAIVLLSLATLLLIRHLLRSSEPETTMEAKPLVESPWTGLWWIPFAVSVPLYILGYDWGRWASLVLTMFLFTVCRVTRIVRPVTLSSPAQVVATVGALTIGMPSHILAPAASLTDTNSLALLKIISNGFKKPVGGQNSEEFARLEGSVYESAPETEAEIVVAGDSIALLCPWSEFLGRETENRGAFGDTSKGLLARLPEIRRHHPKVLVVIVGANDVRNGTTTETILANIKSVVSAALAPTVLVLGVLPADPTILAPEAVTDLDQALKAAFGTNFVAPPARWTWQRDTFDGLHPNGEGYKLIADEIRNHLNDPNAEFREATRLGLRIENGPEH